MLINLFKKDRINNSYHNTKQQNNTYGTMIGLLRVDSNPRVPILNGNILFYWVF